MRKLMWFTIGFGIACLLAGYLLSCAYYLPAAVICSILLAAALMFLLKFRQARLPAAVFFGMLIGFCWQFLFDSLYLSDIHSCDGNFLYTEAVVLEEGEQTNYGFRTEALLSLNGKYFKTVLYLDEQVHSQIGDTLSGTFQLRSCLEGGSAASSYNRGNGLFLTANAVDAVTVSTPQRLPWYCGPAYIRQSITTQLDSIFPADTLGFARALLLGDTERIDYETDTDLKISGIRHVIAVSGLHVTILVGFLTFLFGKRRWMNAAVVLPALLFFAAVVGFSPSITRACLMHGIMVVATLFEKEYDGPSALSFAVLVMLLCNPMTAIHVSFQLSVGCMAGIFLFAEPIRNWLLEKRRLGKFRCKRICSWFASSVGISIGAAVITTPLSALYFGTVSLIGILTNLLTLWVITYIFYGLIFTCVVSFLFQPLGILCAGVISWGIRYVLAVAGVLADFPLAAVYTDSIYIIFWLLFCYALLGAYLCLHRKRPVVYGCCAILTLCLALMCSWTEPLLDGCRMTVLDVGQGQCVLLQSEGRNYLVDCGGDSDAKAADRAANFLLSQGISRLDGIIVTHYDRDHAGGVWLLMSRIPADVLYLPESRGTDTMADTLMQTQSQIVTVCCQLSIHFGKAQITLIPPASGSTDNENGLCILFQREMCDILITGDRSESGERSLMQAIELPHLEVLVVGHHGSKYSTCEELLTQTTPQFAVISVGADNSFGHPAQEVLDRLEAYGCTYDRTDLSGTVIYRG